MKKAVIIIGLLFGFIGLQAQDGGKQQGTDCYSKWLKKFKERGCEDVGDGIYTDVIVVVREITASGPTTNCYDGKVEVKGGKVMNFFILLEDGTYEKIPKELKQETRYVTIEEGMSKTIVTKDNTLINILWPKKIKPKKAPFKKAAEPTDD
ncbi:MAG TPA: hypothetical protein VGF30_06410 [Bacteroidia bacterium]